MVSFIVIGRNESWRLERCFKGIYTFVEAESINDYEVIYVDSKSTDGSVELSKQFGNNKTILITGECNAAIARNIGAKEASGEILFFLDGDMELIPGFWGDVVKARGMVYPFMSGLDKNVWHDKDWNYVDASIDRKYTEGKDTYEVTTGGLFIIEADLWKRVGGMDNRFRRSQDLDMGFRLTKMGYKLCRKPVVWVNHITQYYQTRKDSSSFVKYTAMLLRKHFFELTAQKFLFGPNYSMWALVFCLILMVFLQSCWPALGYVVIVLIRSFRTYRKLLVKQGFGPLFIRQLKNDSSFLYYFCFFWPKTSELEYNVL